MSEHCEHCDHGGLQYDAWDHHCVLEGAGYVHWDDGKCPLCAVAEAERAAIVAWLREGGQGMKLVAAAIERGEHLGGDDE